MIIPFAWGLLQGILIGTIIVTIYVYWRTKKAAEKCLEELEKHAKNMEDNPLDITSELAAAHNVIHQYCAQREECEGCILLNACGDYMRPAESPCNWPEIKISDKT